MTLVLPIIVPIVFKRDFSTGSEPPVFKPASSSPYAMFQFLPDSAACFAPGYLEFGVYTQWAINYIRPLYTLKNTLNRHLRRQDQGVLVVDEVHPIRNYNSAPSNRARGIPTRSIPR